MVAAGCRHQEPWQWGGLRLFAPNRVPGLGGRIIGQTAHRWLCCASCIGADVAFSVEVGKPAQSVAAQSRHLKTCALVAKACGGIAAAGVR